MAYSILICRIDSLGDSILTLPVVEDIRKSFPDARIDYCTSERTAPIVKLCPTINNVWQYPNNSNEIKAFYSKLFSNSFDAVIMCYPKPVSLAWHFMRKKIKIRVGTKRRWWGVLFNYGSRVSRSKTLIHEFQANRELAAIAIDALGGDSSVINTPAKVSLQVSGEDKKILSNKLNDLGLDKYCLIQAGSRGSSMDWSLENMAKAADLLSLEGKKIVFHIGPNEDALYKKLNSLCEQKHYYIGYGAGDSSFNLPQLVELLSSAVCVLANSTGPLHIAAAVGTPVIGLYPPVNNLDPSRWRPLGDKDNQVILMPKYQNLYKSRKYAPNGLMDNISINSVCEAVNGFWNK